MLPTPSPLNQPSMSHSHLMLSTCKTKCLHLPLQSRALGCVHLFHWVTQPLLHHLDQKPARHPGQIPPRPTSHAIRSSQSYHMPSAVLNHFPTSPPTAIIFCLDNHKSHLLGPSRSAPHPNPFSTHQPGRQITNSTTHHFFVQNPPRPSHYREYTLHMTMTCKAQRTWPLLTCLYYASHCYAIFVVCFQVRDVHCRNLRKCRRDKI